MSVSVEGLRNAADFMRQQTCIDPKWLRDAADEIDRLRAIEKAARDYYLGYVQDEADDAECCIVEAQHGHAKALRDALGEK